MEAFAHLAGRLERILPMLEEWLRIATGAQPEEDFFASYRAFRWDSAQGPGRLVPIAHPASFRLEDLQGVDESVARLVANTEQFLRGLPYNHVLLYGERGTGKSSAIKGLLEAFGDRGLRLVEVKREHLVEFPRLLAALRAGRKQHFIVFCDDLSFGIGEQGFRELKTALEGSLEEPPANVCLVATSNRRHLLPEFMEENREAQVDARGELRLGEATNEKLALADRFGLALGFHGFDQETYLAIVSRYIGQADVGLGLDDVREDALRFALERASRSGRTARQFVDERVGRYHLERETG